MSVEKVNQYKESKKNRKQEIEKQKKKAATSRIVTWVVIIAVLVALAVGLVITVVNQVKASASTDTQPYAYSSYELMDYADIEGTASTEE